MVSNSEVKEPQTHANHTNLETNLEKSAMFHGNDKQQTANFQSDGVETNLKLVEKSYKMILELQSKADFYKNKRDYMRNEKK